MDEKENSEVKPVPATEKQDTAQIKKKKDEKPKKKDTKKKTDDNKKKTDDKNKKEESKPRKGPGEKILRELRQREEKKREIEEQKKKEREERKKQELEERKRIEEELRLEEERKEKLKQKKKDRKQKLKEEGKLLSAKQKKDQQKNKELVELYKAQGLIDGEGKSAGFKKRSKKKQEKKDGDADNKDDETVAKENGIEKSLDAKNLNELEVQKADDNNKDDSNEIEASWNDLCSSDDDGSSDSNESEHEKSASSSACDVTDAAPKRPSIVENGTIVIEEKISNLQISKKNDEIELKVTKTTEKLVEMLADNEASSDSLRSPVVCVLGHVDHGKTKILDKLKGTNVAEGEAGAITQEIRATVVSPEIIKSQTRMVNDFNMDDLKFPGILVIDTPGHESFSNLRSRGSSLCDFAILVIDINQGIQQTTKESIKLLKNNRTPFIVALNKVDMLYEWKSQPNRDISDALTNQGTVTSNDFDRRTKFIIQSLNEEGLNAALFWDNKDTKQYVSLVPTSAILGDGMGNLVSNLCLLCQNRLSKRLQFSEDLQCTVLEVSTIQGYGTTVYVVLVNGRLKEGQTIIVAGIDGPIVTSIRSLHIQKPKSKQFDEYKEVTGTKGVMIAAKDLEKAIAGFSLYVANDENEVEQIKEMVDNEFKRAMKAMKVKDKGVYVQASSIGALEALLVLFKTQGIPYSGIKVGPVVKKDVMKASAMLEHDPLYAVILAFNVKVERDAQELADKEGIRIFSEPIIYHLVDRFNDYISDYRKKKQEEFKLIAVFPCRLKILPECIYNKRDPIVLGVSVESGVLRSGTPLCVMTKESKDLKEKEFIDLGVVTSLEFDHKSVELAKKGVEVCIKIENINSGSAPKLFGRHFDEADELLSKVSRESIDACKAHFRDDLTKSDWKVMADLKKLFNIF